MAESSPLLGPIQDPQPLLPLLNRPSTEPQLTVIKAPPEDLFVMMQSIILERPVIAQYLENSSPGDLINLIGWVMGLMHNQTPALWKAVNEAIEIGKDVAIVLREQLEREHKEKTGNPLIFPTEQLQVIWPTGMVLNQFLVADTANNFVEKPV